MSTQAEKDKAEGLQQENAMISRKAEASKAVSDLEQQLAEKRRWESSRDDAAKTKRDCEKREKDIKADAPARKAALDKARRDQEEATTSWTARKKKARSKTNGAKAAVLTQRLFPHVSELQGRVDGVDVAVRASTRLVRGRFVTASFHAGLRRQAGRGPGCEGRQAHCGCGEDSVGVERDEGAIRKRSFGGRGGRRRGECPNRRGF